MDGLRNLKWTIRLLNLRVWFVLTCGVDTDADDWDEELARRLPRNLGQTVLAAVDLYVRGDAATRQVIRELFRKYDNFAWAAALPFAPDDCDHTFAHLIHLSILDQGRDPRDAIAALEDLLDEANVPPAELARLQQRAAELSSEVDPHQWFGSTAKMLREKRPRARARPRRRRS